MDKNLKLTSNFFYGEFWDHSTEPPGKYFENIRKLANELQKVRDAVDRPIKINSGWRSKEYNASLPDAASNSQHLIGKAADVVIKGLAPKFAIIYLAKYGNFNGFGVANTYTHVDIRNDLTVWTY